MQPMFGEPLFGDEEEVYTPARLVEGEEDEDEEEDEEEEDEEDEDEDEDDGGGSGSGGDDDDDDEVVVDMMDMVDMVGTTQDGDARRQVEVFDIKNLVAAQEPLTGTEGHANVPAEHTADRQVIGVVHAEEDLENKPLDSSRSSDGSAASSTAKHASSVLESSSQTDPNGATSVVMPAAPGTVVQSVAVASAESSSSDPSSTWSNAHTASNTMRTDRSMSISSSPSSEHHISATAATSMDDLRRAASVPHLSTGARALIATNARARETAARSLYGTLCSVEAQLVPVEAQLRASIEHAQAFANDVRITGDQLRSCADLLQSCCETPSLLTNSREI
mmetsp:Transcript_42616/g.107529  ORF Transcript_42616/g.107529 Transcript_42616/m.107529 type:complete len:335 (-) Transcript_42616:1489-2493(-)